MKQVMKQGGLVAQNTALQEKPKQERFSDFLSKPATQQWLINSVGEKKKDVFASSILSAVSNNVQLQMCKKDSILSSALLANALNLSLSPQLGYAYLVPFKNKAKIDKATGEVLQGESYSAQFVLGYKGYLQLAIRSGLYKYINVVEIKEGELKSYDRMTGAVIVDFIEDDEERAKKETVGYYAMFELLSGFQKHLYWSKKKMLAHANQYSAAFNSEDYKKLVAGKIPQKEMWKYSSFWYKDFDGMAFKTMIRQLIGKWGLMSIEMQKAFESDFDGAQEYAQSQPNFIEPIDLPTETAEETAEATAEEQAAPADVSEDDDEPLTAEERQQILDSEE